MIQMGVLEKIPRQGSISAKGLAARIQTNEEVISEPECRNLPMYKTKCMLAARLLRMLSATGILEAVGEDVFAHTRFSLAYIEGSEVDFFTLWHVFPDLQITTLS
jgi:hypothetical protein